MTAKLTGVQCKSARALLKWNVHDLAHRAKGIQPKRIEGFEAGKSQFLPWECEEVVNVFKKAGIEFKGETSVTLKTGKPLRETYSGSAQGEGARIVLDADQTVISDSSLDKTAALLDGENAVKNEANRLKIEAAKLKSGQG